MKVGFSRTLLYCRKITEKNHTFVKTEGVQEDLQFQEIIFQPKLQINPSR